MTIFEKYYSDGFFIVRKAVPTSLVDLANEEFDKYADIKGLDVDAILWRGHGLHEAISSINKIINLDTLSNLAKVFTKTECEPKYTILFKRGSQQRLHQDMYVFSIKNISGLVGCWIALEDIQLGSGPLVYYPRSHLSTRRFEEVYSRYPKKTLRNSSAKTELSYYAWVDDEAKHFTKKQLVIKKGDAMFWHSNLIHGGELVTDESLTRRSLVIHYTTQENDVSGNLEGPFLW